MIDDMKEFLIELQALLEKYNAVIFYDKQDKISFEITIGRNNEVCHTYEHVIDSNDLNMNIHENDEH